MITIRITSVSFFTNLFIHPETSQESIMGGQYGSKSLQAFTPSVWRGFFIGRVVGMADVVVQSISDRLGRSLGHYLNVGINPIFIVDVAKDGSDIANNLQTIINGVTDNSTIYYPNGIYGISTSVNVNKRLKFTGDNVEFRTLTNGLVNMFNFTMDKVDVKGITFNQNLKGRNTLNITNATKIKINDCEFTGYSADYGYYATDSAVIIGGTTTCKYVEIKNNIWRDNGNQYDNTTYLNRCITIQGTQVNKADISNNIFDGVNQGVVTTDKLLSLVFSNNIVDGVRDNSLYILGTKKSVITGNDFLNGSDECIVIYGDDVNISGNNFTEIPNKVVAVNGSIQNLNVSNNNYRNETTQAGMFISFRHITDTVTNLIVDGNIVHLKVSNPSSPKICYFGYVTNFLIGRNIFNVNTIANQVLFYFEENSNGRIENNRLIGVDFTTSAVSLGSAFTSGSIVFKKNDLSNVRIRTDNPYILVDGYFIQDNAGPYANANSTVREAYLNRIPIIGTWRKQDRIYNTSLSPSSYLGWVCTTTGTANTTAWVTGTAYTVGQNVNNNGNVYQCITAGTSGATAPTGTGSSISDGGATWKYIDVLAVFKGFGSIQA